MYICNFAKPLITNVKDRYTSRYIMDANEKIQGKESTSELHKYIRMMRAIEKYKHVLLWMFSTEISKHRECQLWMEPMGIT